MGEQMQQLKRIGICVGVLSLACTTLARSAPPSQADRDFVAKVSQGGLYEVEAGKVASMRGTVPVTREFGVLEAHDHEGVNSRLKSIATMTGISITPGLNTEFSERLAKLKAVPAAQFDAYYVNDMKQIHNKDEGLFVEEGNNGSTPYKRFAHETAVLVQAHLGWLNTL
jgi:putative membrane protein